MVLQFLAAGIIAVSRIGVIVQDDKAGTAMGVSHADNHQRVVAHIRAAPGTPRARSLKGSCPASDRPVMRMAR